MRPATVGPSSRPSLIPGVARDRSSIPRATPGAGCSQIRLTRHGGNCYSTRLLDNTRAAAKSFHWQHGRRSSLASGSNAIGHHGAPDEYPLVLPGPSAWPRAAKPVSLTPQKLRRGAGCGSGRARARLGACASVPPTDRTDERQRPAFNEPAQVGPEDLLALGGKRGAQC